MWIVLFLLPTIALFVTVFLVSIVILFGTSFTEWRIGSKIEFIGIQNYSDMLFKDEDFRASLRNTIIWIVLQSTVHVGIGMTFALILARKKFYWKFARTVYMIPNIISSAALGMLFVSILNPEFGAVNKLINMIGFKDFSQNWFMDYNTAFFSVTMTWLPYAAVVSILILAELAAIPESVLESAKIDGAGEFTTNLYIVLPMLRNIIGTCIILSATSMLQQLDKILMTTSGGPGTDTMNLPLYIYKTALMDNNFSYANTLGVFLVGLGIVLVVAISNIFKLGTSHD